MRLIDGSPPEVLMNWMIEHLGWIPAVIIFSILMMLAISMSFVGVIVAITLLARFVVGVLQLIGTTFGVNGLVVTMIAFAAFFLSLGITYNYFKDRRNK